MFTTIQKRKMLKAVHRIRYFLLVPAAGIVFLLNGIVSPVLAEESEEEISFADAEIYFELNNSDGDLGIHALIDGDPWKKLKIEDPNGKKMMAVWIAGRLRRQGLTELFFESAEPPFDQLAPKKFFRRFPEGEYEIEGLTVDGVEMESAAVVTQLMPAPPENILLSGVPAAEDCDADPLPAVPEPVAISWDPVTVSHPDIGRTDEPIEVVQYQVVVEELESGYVFNLELPATTTTVELPLGFTALGDEFKFEILVREESGNQTAVESCFQIE
jgi:hypothetical protein